MRLVLLSYAVFNADQIEGLPEKFYPCPVNVVAPDDELPDRAERFLDALPAKVHQSGDRAFYDRVADSITMPPVALFSPRAYFASRSEERRVGKEGVSTGRSRWWPYNKKK